MKTRKYAFVATVLVCACALASALPQVAVLDAVIEDDMDPGVSIAIADKISEALVNSGKYTVLDRASAHLVLKEKEFQLSGLVKTEEIRRAGEYLGADFVVAARAAQIETTYFVSARMIDVKTGAIKAQASVEREGRIAILLGIANAVGIKLAGGVVETLDEQRLGGRQRVAPQQPAQAPQQPAPQPRQPQPAPQPAAADAEMPGVFLGIKAGVNLADAYGDDGWSDTTPGVRFAGGAYLMVRAADVGVELDLFYAQKGYDYDFYDTVNLDNVHNVWTFNYLELPLIAKLYMARTSPLYLGIGLYMAFYLDGTVSIEYATKTSLNSTPNIADVRSLNTFDYGALFDFGVDIPAGRKTVVNLEMRMGLGFASWLDDSTSTPKHLVVSFLGGIGFVP